MPLGGSSGNENNEATPVVEDGFLYIADVWGVVYKIDVRSGDVGRIVWKMDPGTAKPDRNRGVALWGNFVISVAASTARVIATDKETGKVVWDKNLRDQPELEITAAPLALKDEIIIGASGGDNGVRDWIASLDPKTGKTAMEDHSSFRRPASPARETWKDKNNAWQTGGGAMCVTGSYDPATNLTIWGTGNPVPRYDSAVAAGRQPLHQLGASRSDVNTGKIAVVLPVYAERHPRLRRDRHPDAHRRQYRRRARKVVVHVARNGFFYTLDRNNGQLLKAVQYVNKLNWTKGLDPKTGKPIEYNP